MHSYDNKHPTLQNNQTPKQLLFFFIDKTPKSYFPKCLVFMQQYLSSSFAISIMTISQVTVSNTMLCFPINKILLQASKQDRNKQRANRRGANSEQTSYILWQMKIINTSTLWLKGSTSSLKKLYASSFIIYSLKSIFKIRVVFHTLYLYNEVGDPQFFCISATSNLLSDCSKNF